MTSLSLGETAGVRIPRNNSRIEPQNRSATVLKASRSVLHLLRLVCDTVALRFMGRASVTLIHKRFLLFFPPAASAPSIPDTGAASGSQAARLTAKFTSPTPVGRSTSTRRGNPRRT